MVRERREDWPAIYRDAMSKESDPRALDLLADGLAKGGPRELDRLLDSLLAQPHRNPAAFVWLAERAAVDEAMRSRNALRMLQQILTALSRDEFATYRVRLLALAESGGTVPRLLSHLTEAQEHVLFEALRMMLGTAGRFLILDSAWSPDRAAVNHKVEHQPRRLNDGTTFEIYKRYCDRDDIARWAAPYSVELHVEHFGPAFYAVSGAFT